MQKILPCFWYDFTADQAAELYQAALPRTSVATTLHYPHDGLPAFQQDFAGLPLSIELDIDGFMITLVNGGDAFSPNPSLSIMMIFDPTTNANAEAELRHAWHTLTEHGRELIPLSRYPFSPLYSWVEDQFGVSWQLMMPSDLVREDRPFALPALLFGNAVQNKTQAALNLYTEIFEDAYIGTVVPFADQAEPVGLGSVMYSEMSLADQWFVAMDSGTTTDFTFTPGASLLVKCDSQTEIDRLWDGLSANPSAEQAGWCRDEFGFSWQIVPSSLATYVANPAAYAALMTMKKIIVADLPTS